MLYKDKETGSLTRGFAGMDFDSYDVVEPKVALKMIQDATFWGRYDKDIWEELCSELGVRYENYDWPIELFDALCDAAGYADDDGKYLDIIKSMSITNKADVEKLLQLAGNLRGKGAIRAIPAKKWDEAHKVLASEPWQGGPMYDKVHNLYWCSFLTQNFDD